MEASEIITELVNRSKDPYSKICQYEYCPNKEFTASRLNQEYCSYDCKKKANNLKAKEKRDSTKKINLILLKNRDILRDFYNSGKINLTLNELEDMGFKIDFHTHRKKDTTSTKMVPCYYEYALLHKDGQSLIFLEIWKQS